MKAELTQVFSLKSPPRLCPESPWEASEFTSPPDPSWIGHSYAYNFCFIFLTLKDVWWPNICYLNHCLPSILNNSSCITEKPFLWEATLFKNVYIFFWFIVSKLFNKLLICWAICKCVFFGYAFRLIF